MPLYEYRCDRCGHAFEALLARAADPAPCCLQCGASTVKRLLSTFAVAKSTGPAPGPCGSEDCACRPSHD